MSNEVQRLIRKLQPKGPRSFDEQTWPIYVAIVVLCGYLSGVVISILQFNDARWHANAFTWLAVLAILGCVAAWSVSLLQNAIIRRTLILSVLLSLIINLSLLVMMAWTWIFSSTWDDDAKVTAGENENLGVRIRRKWRKFTGEGTGKGRIQVKQMCDLLRYHNNLAFHLSPSYILLTHFFSHPSSLPSTSIIFSYSTPFLPTHFLASSLTSFPSPYLLTSPYIFTFSSLSFVSFNFLSLTIFTQFFIPLNIPFSPLIFPPLPLFLSRLFPFLFLHYTHPLSFLLPPFLSLSLPLPSSNS